MLANPQQMPSVTKKTM